jgi:signal transduction histidine kinase
MVNPKNDNTENMLQRMEKFLYEMCSVKNISYEFINHVPSLKLDMQQRKNLLLVFKEAVNNAAKYSNEKKIVASIYQQKRSIELKVQDDGIGFDLQKIEPGNGLDSMQMRANELRGTLVIDSILNEGTTIIFTLPL